MTCDVHEFDAREGGALRISLTYDAAERSGKTAGRTDTYHGRFVKLVPNELVVEADEFETADPALRGEMLITISLSDADGGTELVATHDRLPRGVSPADNEVGWNEALARLAAHVEVTASEEWTNSAHANRYLALADAVPHRAEGEGVLSQQVPRDARRVLDLGTGDGRLLALLQVDRPGMRGVGLDFSELMLEAAGRRFAGDERIELVSHDLVAPLPATLGRFDVVVSSMAIHHLEHERKRELYGEVFDLLEPGGVFANFEHVASATHRLHLMFFAAIDEPLEHEDPSDRLLDIETQLGWLREHGFDDVDCYWKWLEMALLVGLKPGGPR